MFSIYSIHLQRISIPPLFCFSISSCSSPTNLHTAAEYQSILVNNSTLSTTTSANNKISEQQKQQNGGRSGTSNWPGVVTDYYPALNQQPTLALSDYNCFRDAGYADALHQTVTRSTDDAACLQDHHHHHHHLLHHLPRHHEDQLTMYPKCCSFNSEGFFDENLVLCDTQSIDCRQAPLKDTTTATTITTKSLASTASIHSTRATPFKTFKNPFCPKNGSPVGKIFGTPTTTQAGVSERLLGDQQCCVSCRDSAIVGDPPCSLCSGKDDANSNKKHSSTTFFPTSFHLKNEPLKPDLTQLNN